MQPVLQENQSCRDLEADMLLSSTCTDSFKGCHCGLGGPVWSSPFFSLSHIILSCFPHSCHSYLLSFLLIILFLTITLRLFPLSRMFFLPHFLRLISLHLSELEEVFFLKKLFLICPTRLNTFINRPS